MRFAAHPPLRSAALRLVAVQDPLEAQANDIVDMGGSLRAENPHSPCDHFRDFGLRLGHLRLLLQRLSAAIGLEAPSKFFVDACEVRPSVWESMQASGPKMQGQTTEWWTSRLCASGSLKGRLAEIPLLFKASGPPPLCHGEYKDPAWPGHEEFADLGACCIFGIFTGQGDNSGAPL